MEKEDSSMDKGPGRQVWHLSSPSRAHVKVEGELTPASCSLSLTLSMHPSELTINKQENRKVDGSWGLSSDLQMFVHTNNNTYNNNK